MLRVFYVLLILSALSFAITATQTDWSGGAGVPGPVIDWGNSYDTSSLIVDDTPGGLSLIRTFFVPGIEYVIEDAYIEEGISSVSTADIDGDGDLDVLGGAYYWGRAYWWENVDGEGAAWAEHYIDDGSLYAGPSSMYPTDIQGNGYMDALGAIGAPNQGIMWWKNADGIGIQWVTTIVEDDFSGASSVYAADVDGDGDTDVLGAAEYADDIAWWELDDGFPYTFTRHNVDSNYNGAMSVYAADVDGDGHMDILGAARYANDITWWRNTDGSGTSWTEHTVDPSFNGASSVYAIDVDGDGDMDVLGAAIVADDITWWENTDGSGTSWTEHTVDASFDGASSVYAIDVDGDGDQDVLGAAANANEITCWENTDGSGTSWTEHTADDSFWGAQSVYAADVDGDGDMDALGAAYYSPSVAWWNIIGYTEGYLESSILDAGAVAEWEVFFSNSEEPLNTSVGFQFRSSSDSTNMGAWSDTLFSSSTLLPGILADSTRYLQYKVVMASSDHRNTPSLEDIGFVYSAFVNIGESGSDPVPSWWLRPMENPSYGSLSLLIGTPEHASVELHVHDLNGRVVCGTVRDFQAGSHSVQFHGLAAGVYFCVMRSGDFIASERIVLLK